MNINLDNKKSVLFVAIITSFITTFMGSALNLSIPQIENQFNVGAAQVSWVITIYMLTCAALAVPFGKTGDILDRKKLLCIGLFLFFAGSFTATFSNKLSFLIISRLIQGVGASMIFSTNIAILVSMYETEERGRVIGYATAANYVGLSAGPVLGGFLNDIFGWNSIFIVAATVSFVAFYCAIKKIPSWRDKKTDKYNVQLLNWKAVIMYIISLSLLMYGLSSITSSKIAKYLFFVGLVLFVIFILMELKANNPMIDIKKYLNNRAYLCANFAATFNYGAIFATSYLVSIYLQIVKGYDSKWAGIILVAAPMVQAVISPISGKISDKHSPEIISAVGAFVCGLSTLAFSFLNIDTSITLIILILIVEGIGCALFSSPNSNAVMGNVAREEYGISSSILSTMRSIGHTAAMAFVTMISSLYIGNEKMDGADPFIISEIIQNCFYVFTLWCIIGFLMALRRKP